MQIYPVSYRFNFIKQNNNSISSNNNIKENFQSQSIPFYPKNYQPYFGARLNRTPENFYAQSFNLENMPDTVKAYLMSDFENNREKRPMELQKEAFSWLPECTDVKDVKDMYPDEQLFQNLKTLEGIRPTHGYLCDLRILGATNNTVLKSGEDLTVYLLKKIYLEGKDLEEINRDFKSDVDEKWLDEEHYGQKGYFQYSTLKSLGVKFPDISYWHSLQATRLDKEYIPSTRTFDPTKERKPRIYTPRPPRVLTPEEKQKRSERMINRWLSLSPVQQANQIAKMRAGSLNKESVFFDYISPIMIIATEHIKLSDKLIEFYKNNAVECPVDLSNLTKEQGAKLQKFWNENPQLKEDFSKAIIKTIKIYEKAKALGPQYIEKLNAIAQTIKAKNEIKAYKRSITSTKAINDYVSSAVMKNMGLCYRPYAEKYIAFIQNHKLFKNDFTRIYTKNVMEDFKYAEQNEARMNSIMNTIHKEFVAKNMRETTAVNTAVAEILYRMTNDMMLFSANNTQLLISTIVNNQLENYIRICAGEIEQKVAEYTSGFSEEELRNTYQTFLGVMQSVTKNGYLTLSDPVVRKRSENLTRILKKIEKDKTARTHFKNFIKQYEAQVKFAEKPSTSENLRYYMFESVIDDYLISLGQ